MIPKELELEHEYALKCHAKSLQILYDINSKSDIKEIELCERLIIEYIRYNCFEENRELEEETSKKTISDKEEFDSLCDRLNQSAYGETIAVQSNTFKKIQNYMRKGI